MKTLFRYAQLIVFIFFVAHGQELLAENVILNPSFELAGPAGQHVAASWDLSSGAVPGATNSRSSLMASDGNWSWYMSTIGTDSNGGSLVLAQSRTGLPSLVPSQEIFLTFDLKFFGTSESSGSVEFQISGANGIVDDLNIIFQNSDDFIQVQTESLTVPPFGPFPLSDSYFVQTVFRVSSPIEVPSEYAEAFIDNVVVDAVLVPEPGGSITASLMLLVWLVTATRHRYR